MRLGTGCIHSKRLPGSKYAHCLQECSSKPHLGQRPVGGIPGNTVPHCEQRDTARVPGIFTGRGPKVLSLFGGGPLFFPPPPGGVFSPGFEYPGCFFWAPTETPQVWLGGVPPPHALTQVSFS